MKGAENQQGCGQRGGQADVGNFLPDLIKLESDKVRCAF